MASSGTPKLIIPEDKSTNDPSTSNSTHLPSKSSFASPANEVGTRKLTKILSTQSSFDRHHPPYPVKKRFSIDADPSSILLNLFSSPPPSFSVADPSHQPSTPDPDDSSFSSSSSSSRQIPGKDPSPVRSSSMKKSDSFLGIPYEKGEIVDLIKLADDPNAAAHLTNDGNEVLLEHGAASL